MSEREMIGSIDVAEDWAEEKLMNGWSSESCGSLLTGPLLRSLAMRFHLLTTQTKLRLLLALLSTSSEIRSNCAEDIQRILCLAKDSGEPDVAFCSALLNFQPCLAPNDSSKKKYSFSSDFSSALSLSFLNHHADDLKTSPLPRPLASLQPLLYGYLSASHTDSSVINSSSVQISSQHYEFRSRSSAFNASLLATPPDNIQSDEEQAICTPPALRPPS